MSLLLYKCTLFTVIIVHIDIEYRMLLNLVCYFVHLYCLAHLRLLPVWLRTYTRSPIHFPRRFRVHLPVEKSKKAIDSSVGRTNGLVHGATGNPAE